MSRSYDFGIQHGFKWVETIGLNVGQHRVQRLNLIGLSRRFCSAFHRTQRAFGHNYRLWLRYVDGLIAIARIECLLVGVGAAFAPQHNGLIGKNGLKVFGHKHFVLSIIECFACGLER